MMGFWIDFFKKAWDFIKIRMNKNLEVLVKSFGAMLIVWAVSGFATLMAAISGNADILAFLLSGLGATSQFVVLLLRTMFGKPSEPAEADIVD